MPKFRPLIRAAAPGLLIIPFLIWGQWAHAQTEAEESSDFRVFRSREGSTEYVAKLQEFTGTRVELELAEGETITLKLSDLSRVDQAWIRAADRERKLLNKRFDQVRDLVTEMERQTDVEDIKLSCIKLREFGELAKEASGQLEPLMSHLGDVELAYQATITFAVVSPKTEENWQKVLASLQEGNQQLLLLTEQSPAAMLGALSLYRDQAFPTLKYIAYQADISFDEEELAAELSVTKLNTTSGPDNLLRASACLALGNIPTEDARKVLLEVIKEANVKINGLKDLATIEACLIAFGRHGVDGDKVNAELKKHEKDFKSVVQQARAIIEQRKELKKVQEAVAKIRATHVFTDRRGNQVRARFENLAGGKVRLKDLNDKIVVLPLTEFSEADQEWIQAVIQAREEKKAQEAEKPGADGKSPPPGKDRESVRSD